MLRNWRTHEDYVPLRPRRSIARRIWDGRTFPRPKMPVSSPTRSRRASYILGNRDRYWKKAESAPATLIAWNGSVFIGNAQGRHQARKGARKCAYVKTGKIVRLFYLGAEGGG